MADQSEKRHSSTEQCTECAAISVLKYIYNNTYSCEDPG